MTPKELFKEHCGPRFEKFMRAIYANAQGQVELKFWQEHVVNPFLNKHPRLGLDSNGLMALIRDGTELTFTCPARYCRGTVSFDRGDKEWGCGECGRAWRSKAALMDAIEEAEVRDLDEER